MSATTHMRVGGGRRLQRTMVPCLRLPSDVLNTSVLIALSCTRYAPCPKALAVSYLVLLTPVQWCG